MTPKTILIIIGVLLVTGIALTIFDVSITPPPPWLIAWTGWIASVIGTVVGLRLLWAGQQALLSFVEKCKRDSAPETGGEQERQKPA